MRAALLILAQLAALWPVVHWAAVRLRHDPEPPWELVALAAATALVLRELRGAARGAARPTSPVSPSLALPAGLLGLYAATQHLLPPVARALAATVTLAVTLGALGVGRGARAGVWGLLVLGLPLLPVLQFPLAYPLRVASASLAAPLLRLGGVDAEAAGTCLRWAGELVWVDAPCSGARMIWSSLLVVCALAAFLRLGPGRTALATALALAVLVPANALRTAALFLVETDLTPLPAWGHEAVGLAVHVLALAAVLVLVLELEPRPCAPSSPT